MPKKIVHLSDLHLGDDIFLRALSRKRWWKTRVSEKVTKGLIDALCKIGPDYVVISGDFVNYASPEMFEVACSYVQHLFLQSGISLRDRLLVIPGNHDVSFFPKKHTDDFQRLLLYRKFLLKLFGEEDIESRRQRYFRIDPDAELIFVCIDSTLRDSFPLAEGQIGASQLRWVANKLDRIQRELGERYSRFVKVAVMHHHCVPIAGGAALSDRFMQLLDAGDVMKLLNERGFNIVLHGHRHHPHVWADIRSDSSVITVVGAGTTTCCFVEEQHGFGNNFNLLTLSPERNILTVQRFRAGGNGSFDPEGNAERFPLQRQIAEGYRAELTRKVVTLSADGTRRVDMVKNGLRVEEDNRVVAALPLRILTDVVGSKIVDFRFDRTAVDVRYKVNSAQVIDGEWVPKIPLTNSSSPWDFSYSYTVEGGTAMSQQDAVKLYPSGTSEESTAITLPHPTAVLKMEVVFPKGFKTTPRTVVQRFGANVSVASLKARENYDNLLNTYSLQVPDPPVNSLFTINWSLPAVWP